MTCGADCVAERREELNQDSIWIGFGMRFDCSDNPASQSVIGGFIHQRPSRGCELRKKRRLVSRRRLPLCLAALLFPDAGKLGIDINELRNRHSSPPSLS